MSGMASFGDPKRFEITARWLEDREPREQLPKEFGWSMGELRLTVGGFVLTHHRIHGKEQDALQWYLGPLVSWMIRQWAWLLHEEAFDWRTHQGESAATTVASDLERYFASEYPPDRETYRKVRDWWNRHALRAADPSALYPDIYIRRVDDNIEISWLDRQPEFSPDGFELKLQPGTALLPVEDVAKPLWEFLHWAVQTAHPATQDDRAQIDALRSQLDALGKRKADELEAVHVANRELLAVMRKVRAQSGWVPQRETMADIPAITELDAPALMFGGLNVALGQSDVNALFTLLVAHRNGARNDRLESLVASPSIYEYIQPYTHGYELAYEAREALGIALETAHVDIEAILSELGVTIHHQDLQTDSIRGVAIAGTGLSPAILVNGSSVFNKTRRGRRFTLAHEFCHILYDRSRARRLSHISGPWASPRVEKRANAFATMFLASPHALSKAVPQPGDWKSIKRLSEKFDINTRALIEHLRNLDLISEEQYQALSQKLH